MAEDSTLASVEKDAWRDEASPYGKARYRQDIGTIGHDAVKQ
jgi:hypothetical protein